MALRDTWKNKVDGVDDVLAEHINLIAETVIKNEDDIKKQGEEKQDKLTDEQLENIEKVPEMEEQIENILNASGSLELIYEGTTTEEVSTISVTTDKEGNAFELEELYAIVTYSGDTASSPYVYIADGTNCYMVIGNATGKVSLITSWKRGYIAKTELYQYGTTFKSAYYKEVTDDIMVNQFRMSVFVDSVFPIGTEIKVWGRKVQ